MSNPLKGLRPGLACGLAILALACGASAAWAAAAADSAYTGDLILHPAAPCTDDVVTVFVRGFVATPCDSFLDAEKIDDRTIRIRTQVYSTRECLVAPLQFFSVPVVMGQFPLGQNRIQILRETIVRDEIGGVDTVKASATLDFVVGTVCSPATVPIEDLPFVTSASTLPNPVCPDRRAWLHVAGLLRACGRIVSVDSATTSMVIAPFPPDPNSALCPQLLKPWSVDFPLGTLASGHFTVTMRMTVTGTDKVWPPIPTETYTGRFAFDVPRDCGSSLPYVDFIRVAPQPAGVGPICPSDSLQVFMGGTFPDGCFHVVGLEPIDPSAAGSPGLRLTVADEGCTRVPCSVDRVTWIASRTLPPAATCSRSTKCEAWDALRNTTPRRRASTSWSLRPRAAVAGRV